MKIDLVILQFAIIFLPGLILAGLDSRYALKSKPSEFQFTLRAFLFGLVSYAVTFGLYTAAGWPFSLTGIPGLAANGTLNAAIVRELASAIGVGLLLAVLWLYGLNRKWDTRLLQKIGATRTYGDEDVWDFTLNSSRPGVEYIHFRDFGNQIVYAGWIDQFSATDKLRELVLNDVEIYDFDGKKLFDTPRIYLARQSDNIHIEFPYRGRPNG